MEGFGGRSCGQINDDGIHSHSRGSSALSSAMLETPRRYTDFSGEKRPLSQRMRTIAIPNVSRALIDATPERNVGPAADSSFLHTPGPAVARSKAPPAMMLIGRLRSTH